MEARFRQGIIKWPVIRLGLKYSIILDVKQAKILVLIFRFLQLVIDFHLLEEVKQVTES